MKVYRNIAQPNQCDYKEAEGDINKVLYNKGMSALNTYERFSPDWYNIFNQNASIAYRITYDNLTEYKDRYTFQDIPKLDNCAKKLVKINLCVGKIHQFFIKAVNLIDTIKENINLLPEDVESSTVPPLKKQRVEGIRQDVTIKENIEEDEPLRKKQRVEGIRQDVTEINQKKQSKRVPKKFTFSGAEIYRSGLTVQSDW